VKISEISTKIITTGVKLVKISEISTKIITTGEKMQENIINEQISQPKKSTLGHWVAIIIILVLLGVSALMNIGLIAMLAAENPAAELPQVILFMNAF